MNPHRFFVILTLCYALFIIWVDILPLHPILSWTEGQGHFFWKNPFHFHVSSRGDFTGNIIFFVPLGFFIAMAVQCYLPGGVWTKRCLQISAGVLSGLTLSALAESIQAFLPMRVSSWMDLIANTAGAAGGAIAGSLVSGSIFQRLGHRYRMVSRADPAHGILIIYVMILFFIALVPFDIDITPWNIYYKWKNGLVILWPSSLHSPGWQVWLRLLIKQLAWYLPLGVLCAYILKSHSRLKSAGIVWAISAGTTLYALLLECLQLIIRTRTTSLPDALSAGAASALGALALTIFYRQAGKSKQADICKISAPFTWIVSISLLTGYSLLLLCIKLQPFDFIFDPMAVKQKLDAFNFIPFMGYVRGGSSDPGIILFDLAREGLLYLPVGLIICFAMHRAFPRAANKTVFAIAFFIGCIVSGSGEIGQIFLATRYADLTDILLGACGAGVGSLLPCAVRSNLGLKTSCFVFLFIGTLLVSSSVCFALTPEQVVVVANKMAWHSCKLAKYYMEKRGIPESNLIRLKAPAGERCSRDDYDKCIASPIRAFLKKHDAEGQKFRCLVLMYGIPLRVAPPELTAQEQKRLAGLQKQRDAIRVQINAAQQEGDEKIEDLLRPIKEADAQIKKQIDRLQKRLQGASVDSELALIREENYPLEGWLPNKYFLGYRNKKIENMPQKVMLISRIDGPSEKIVRRIIDDSLQTEKEGLHGTAYFDARYPAPGDKKVSGYAFYDRAIHNAARLVEKSRSMPVVLDSQQKLFEVGQCPDAALYCGWYKLAHYVDAFTWARGAVGFHIASGECTTLKGGSNVWCKVMLEKGVAATIGPVSEPYVQAFPIPDLFFSLLIDGRLTLAECYALSNPYWSWQMVLIGDPLYSPFKNKIKKIIPPPRTPGNAKKKP